MAADVSSSPSLWVRVSAMPEMYPTFSSSSEFSGLFGATTETPFNLSWTGLISFAGEGGGLPTYNDSVYSAFPMPSMDINYVDVAPLTPSPAPAATHSINITVVFQPDEFGVNHAYINGETWPGFSSGEMTSPHLYSYMSPLGGDLPPIPTTSELPGDAITPFVIPFGAVVDVTVTNWDGGEHPFHLHGHNFYVLETSAGTPTEAQVAASAYVMRDVVSVPAGGDEPGYAIIRFVADNPGVWLFHCHIECVRLVLAARCSIAN